MSAHDGEENQPTLMRIALTFFASVAAISSVMFIISRTMPVRRKLTHCSLLRYNCKSLFGVVINSNAEYQCQQMPQCYLQTEANPDNTANEESEKNTIGNRLLQLCESKRKRVSF
eukprot:1874359-Pleurochrysis_carterae.AAC.2